ncbi:MAG: nuclear transport factor 2 family protein [Burkholderiales bacterium]|nr:nuclear transport factor 2 family protein [Burkholderiales bacterium]
MVRAPAPVAQTPSVKKTLFATPQDAEAAFYDALTKSDLEAMMAVWADDDDVYCVHPNGARVSGVEQIRESWRQIFASGQRLSFRLRESQYVQGMMLSVHSVYEHVGVAGESRARAPVIATNVFLRTERGWRMVAHHASPAPAAAGAEPEARRAPQPKTLH